MKILKGLLMIITAPVILVLTLFVWLCTEMCIRDRTGPVAPFAAHGAGLF